MKKIIKKWLCFVLCFLYILCFLLTACKQNDSKPISDVSTASKSFSNLAEYDDEFYDGDKFNILFKDNPIDKDFDSIKTETGSLAMLYPGSEFRDYWSIELDNAYDELLERLESDDLAQLKASQEAWEAYLEKWKSLRTSFYYDDKYRIQNMDVRGKKMVDEMYKVRERTRELMEYLYVIDVIANEVNFVYGARKDVGGN